LYSYEKNPMESQKMMMQLMEVELMFEEPTQQMGEQY
jgi:hypothetical protein